MPQSTETKSPVLQSLFRHPLVRAVVRVDNDGEVVDRVGQAYSLKEAATDSSVVMPIDTAEDEDPEESLYICSYEGDYLVVIFDDQSEFESLKKDIDSTVSQHQD